MFSDYSKLSITHLIKFPFVLAAYYNTCTCYLMWCYNYSKEDAVSLFL